MDDTTDHPPQRDHRESPPRGRDRSSALTRTVLAAVATATFLGAGFTVLHTAGGTDSLSATVADIDSDRTGDQAGRGSDRSDETPPRRPDAAMKRTTWMAPSTAAISDVFGPRDWRAGEMHYGADWAAAPGQLNYAIHSGTVLQAGPNGAYGNSVIIDHGHGIVSVYGHHSKVLVSVGDKVRAGDPVGEAGSTGDATGPHVHLEIHVDTVAVDPIAFLKEHGVDM